MATLTMKYTRRGLATVETALVFPLLILITFGLIEYGWMFLTAHQVTNAARQAARVAATPDATNASVTALVSSMMTNAGLSNSGYTLTFTPANIATPTSGQTVMVQISIPYSNISITHSSLLPLPTSVQAGITMAKEGP